MHESPPQTPPATRWLRIAALAALLALGFHGVAALGHQHDAGGDQDCTFCHSANVQVLAPESPAPPHALPSGERSSTEPVLAAGRSFHALPPLRGPPAA